MLILLLCIALYTPLAFQEELCPWKKLNITMEVEECSFLFDPVCGKLANEVKKVYMNKLIRQPHIFLLVSLAMILRYWVTLRDCVKIVLRIKEFKIMNQSRLHGRIKLIHFKTLRSRYALHQDPLIALEKSNF